MGSHWMARTGPLSSFSGKMRPPSFECFRPHDVVLPKSETKHAHARQDLQRPSPFLGQVSSTWQSESGGVSPPYDPLPSAVFSVPSCWRYRFVIAVKSAWISPILSNWSSSVTLLPSGWREGGRQCLDHRQSAGSRFERGRNRFGRHAIQLPLSSALRVRNLEG